MRLSDGLSLCVACEVIGRTDLEIEQIVTDSRKVKKGALFVALPGTKQDGRAFIAEAVKRGAAVIVAEKEAGKNKTAILEMGVSHLPIGEETTVFVQDAHEALFRLSSHLAKKPAEKLRLVGITGTNGKTTTAFLVQSLLSTNDKRAGLIGTIHTDFGGNKKPITASQTTPGILELQEIFAQMEQQGTTHVAMEVSSHSLDQRRTFGLRFETAVFTNLTQDHLDYHQTMDQYYEAKKKLFFQTDGLSVINVDDPWGVRLKDEAPGKTLCYGIDRRDDIYPTTLTLNLKGIAMAVQTPIGEIEIRSALIGQYNVYNILGAIGVGIASGLSKESIADRIAAMQSVPGRFEKIDLGQDFLVVVDYAHTDDAISRLLQSVSSLTLGHVITVVGCGGDRDKGKRPKMAQAASLYSRLSILTSDNPRSEPPLSILKEMEAGLLGQNPKPRYEMIPDRKMAIARAISLAQTGDTVVIAGKGHETDQMIGETKTHFDDREIARDALSKRAERPLRMVKS
ncbi:MAG: UDP-N-acetylmuramoyl-L-alanyl-D-glutamate--2,6-diaminopimelate ligase [Nitrospirota bacterium]